MRRERGRGEGLLCIDRPHTHEVRRVFHCAASLRASTFPFFQSVVFQPFLEKDARRPSRSLSPSTGWVWWLKNLFPLNEKMASPLEKGIQLSRYIFVSERKQQNQLVSDCFSFITLKYFPSNSCPPKAPLLK